MQVAAVDQPKLHMWETGIMRITRHPQMVSGHMASMSGNWDPNPNPSLTLTLTVTWHRYSSILDDQEQLGSHVQNRIYPYCGILSHPRHSQKK